jgi:hypothetical protein
MLAMIFLLILIEAKHPKPRAAIVTGQQQRIVVWFLPTRQAVSHASAGAMKPTRFLTCAGGYTV